MYAGLDAVVAKIAAAAGKTNAESKLRPLLDEAASIYCDLSPGQAEWLRAQVYGALARGECGPLATRAAVEDLRTSYNPVVLSGASRCLAAQNVVDPAWVEIAQTARQRVALRDVYPDIRIPSPSGCCGQPKTALGEIDALLDRLAGNRGPFNSTERDDIRREAFALCPKLTAKIAFRDQDDRSLNFAKMCGDQPVIIAFFYTRCMNPQKCSLTISRLGALSLTLTKQATAIRCFGITYDPRFDTSPRLAAYGQDRNFPFSERNRLVRCTSGWPILRRLFDLHVGFGASVVNGHARELFFLDGGKLAERRHPDDLSDSTRWCIPATTSTGAELS